MWRKLLLPALVFGIFYPVATSALTISSVEANNFEEALADEITVTVSKLKGADVTDLRTTIVGTNSGAIMWRNEMYFTNSEGLFVQKMGSRQVNQLIDDSSLIGLRRIGDKLLVSRSRVTPINGGSYLYSMATNKVIRLSTSIVDIVATDVTPDNKKMVVLADNEEGKQKLFITTSTLQTFKTLALPKYATDCTEVSISPNGRLLHIGCSFKLPGKAKTSGAVFVFLSSTGQVIRENRSVKDFGVVSTTWLSNTTLITIQDDADGETTINQINFKDGVIVGKKVIQRSGFVVIDGRYVYLTPLQIVRQSDDHFYFNFLYVDDLNNPTYFGSQIYVHDLSLPLSTLLMDNGKLTLLKN